MKHYTIWNKITQQLESSDSWSSCKGWPSFFRQHQTHHLHPVQPLFIANHRNLGWFLLIFLYPFRYRLQVKWFRGGDDVRFQLGGLYHFPPDYVGHHRDIQSTSKTLINPVAPAAQFAWAMLPLTDPNLNDGHGLVGLRGCAMDPPASQMLDTLWFDACRW